jgi:hypothetical protein
MDEHGRSAWGRTPGFPFLPTTQGISAFSRKQFLFSARKIEE